MARVGRKSSSGRTDWSGTMGDEARVNRYDLIKRIAEKINETATNLFTPGELEDDERYSD